MKKLYLFAFIIYCCLTVHSQPPVETVGNPVTSTSIAAYTGWSNQGIMTYTGNAEVQNINPSNSQYASGGGNVFLTNTPGVYFQVSGIPPSEYHDAIELNFELFGYDTAHLDELNLTISIDSGVTWSSLPYHRSWGTFFAPTSWDYFSAGIYYNATNINVTKMMFRFTQSTSIKTFRIDDLRLTYYVLLPIKLTYFTATVNNGVTVLNWKASTSSNKELFVVEKSKDGILFSNAAQQYAKGAGEYSYTCNDEFNRNSKTFYRLKMTSTDGKVSYSKTIILNSESFNPTLIQTVYPLPAKDILHVLLNNNASKKIYLSVIDSKGSQRIQRSIIVSNGITDYQLNIQHLPTGIYYLMADNLQTKQTKKK